MKKTFWCTFCLSASCPGNQEVTTSQ